MSKSNNDEGVPRDSQARHGCGSDVTRLAAGYSVAKPAVDYTAYFVTGAGDPRTIVDRATAAARGGAGVIQVRSKPISARELFQLGAAVAEAVAEVAPGAASPAGAGAEAPSPRVLIDDRVDIALALRAQGFPIHGVHVGQDDLPVTAVRQLLGPDAIIGLTTGTLDLVHAANEHADVLDYIGCGPFRDTPTKRSGRTPLGLAGYPPIVRASAVPVVAIGDVTADDAADLATTGVAGVAVVRGIMNAEDPENYVRTLRSNFRAGQRSVTQSR
ncbi:thiamine phosphate synthase [Corynebacterium sp. zg254]|uniref:Thiamine-phosphate synthase n=1 Tax=Corynebacterium zhongnanshanii TaxID=2768834 RepID=A0ABQ6VG28_9CORY|nr:MULTISPECIES: thiamine phosphate synthase [Corynebacterium]KAB3523149.1 thiamine phosphate synthase [Corynebacterium zhongnanshanii]MCR5913745.1 thiamine phosphate synthase [Corynebacterium sp. zg254]